MRRLGHLIFIGTVLGLSGCGAASSQYKFNQGGIIKSGNDVVAYVLGQWSSVEQMVYIPSVDRYAKVNMETGAYVSNSVYYSAAGCTGTKYGSYVGPTGKTVFLSSDGKYYLSETFQSSDVAIGSGNNGVNGACQDNSGTVGNMTTVSETTQPYNFAAIAPLTVTWE